MSDSRFFPDCCWCYDFPKAGRQPNPMLGLCLSGTPHEAAAKYLWQQRERRPSEPHRCYVMTGPHTEPMLIELDPLTSPQSQTGETHGS